MVFVADDLGAWLVTTLADAGRRRLTTSVLGTDQQRALNQAATVAVRRTAEELCTGDNEEAHQLAMIISQVFDEPLPESPETSPATLLESLQTGISRQLAVLDDISLTETELSSAGVLGIQAGTIGKKLTGHLVQEIVNRGARGGPLFPMASSLNQNVSHMQGQRLESLVGQLADEVRGALAQLGSNRGRLSVESEKIYINYTLNLSDQLEFNATAWANALSHERRRMVEEAVGESLDDEFALYGGRGIAECVERGELEFTATTEAEIEAEFDAEAIEGAIRAYAGIGEYDEWPDGLERPSANESSVTVHDGVEYVVLRREHTIVAVYDIAVGNYDQVKMWPPEIEES